MELAVSCSGLIEVVTWANGWDDFYRRLYRFGMDVCSKLWSWLVIRHDTSAVLTS